MRSHAIYIAPVFLSAAVALAGCASIVHSGPRKVPVSSTPPGATVVIYDRDGTEVTRKVTPFTATLSPKYRYFKGQSYRLVFELPGYKTSEVQLRPSTSGWYFGNLLIGGALGMLIVDPLTGAMYNLTPNKIEHSMTVEIAAQ